MNSELKVQQQENKGRQTFTTIFSGVTWTENPERYGIWDLSATTVSNKVYTEIKSRNISSKDFSTTFLEVKKYQNITDLAKANEGKAFYFVTYSDDVSFLFDLSKLDLTEIPVKEIWMNNVTIGGTTPIHQVKKEVYDLPLTAAIRRNK